MTAPREIVDWARLKTLDGYLVGGDSAVRHSAQVILHNAWRHLSADVQAGGVGDRLVPTYDAIQIIHAAEQRVLRSR